MMNCFINHKRNPSTHQGRQSSHYRHWLASLLNQPQVPNTPEPLDNTEETIAKETIETDFSEIPIDKEEQIEDNFPDHLPTSAEEEAKDDSPDQSPDTEDESPETRFEFVVRISGIRYTPSLGDKFTIDLYPFLSVTESANTTDYSIVKHPYRINCEALCLEGPGVANQGKAVIITAEFVSARKLKPPLVLPEKYQCIDLNTHNTDLLPNVNSIICFLFDPKKTIDPFEGLLLSFTRRNFAKQRIEEKKLFCPEKYESLLQEIQASGPKIGKIPEYKLKFQTK